MKQLHWELRQPLSGGGRSTSASMKGGSGGSWTRPLLGPYIGRAPQQAAQWSCNPLLITQSPTVVKGGPQELRSCLITIVSGTRS